MKLPDIILALFAGVIACIFFALCPSCEKEDLDRTFNTHSYGDTYRYKLLMPYKLEEMQAMYNMCNKYWFDYYNDIATGKDLKLGRSL